jgi:DnaK suppressor protein
VAKLSSKQLQSFKRLLIDQLTSLYRDVHGEVRDSTVRALFDQDEPRDEADESLRVQLRDARMSLAEAEARRAQQIEAAIHRIGDGTYGECTDCGQQIELERLKAVPWAERCIEDQEAFEREHEEHPATI